MRLDITQKKTGNAVVPATLPTGASTLAIATGLARSGGRSGINGTSLKPLGSVVALKGAAAPVLTAAVGALALLVRAGILLTLLRSDG